MYKNILYALKISWAANPLRVILDLVVKLLFRAFVVFYNVFFLGYVLKSIEDGYSLNQIWLLVGISIIVMVGYDFLAAWYYNTYWPYVNQGVYQKYKLLIYNKASAVDLACYEDSEFYNNHTKASSEIISRFEALLGDVLNIVVDLLMNSYLLITILQLDSPAAIICFLPMFIKSIIGKTLNDEKYRLYAENVVSDRKMDYIKRTIYLKDYCKELHTSNIFALLSEKFETASGDIKKNIKKYGLKIAVYDFLNSTSVTVFTYFLAITYASYKALVAKSLSVGDYIILINAISKLSSMLTDFVDRIIQLNEHSKYIGNIREFLHTESCLNTGSRHIRNEEVNSVEFKNVSFAYNGQKENCLNRISISIKKGERVAIIGLNGAGKTTLVKLLMRLYDVPEGEILLNGVNIKDYLLGEYRSIFSTVFQDYKIYSATVAENVILDTEGDKTAEIIGALQNSGIYQYLNNQYGNNLQQQMLTKEFDENGLVLSGGQFQKIAIARAFAKHGGIAILDEPSSALDPIAEKEMFRNLLNASKDKMVIFISHRLSAAALADRIYVMQNGSLVELGTHEQLMSLKGIYYDMYIKQNQKFASDGEIKE